jgi:hypothetical protein
LQMLLPLSGIFPSKPTQFSRLPYLSGQSSLPHMNTCDFFVVLNLYFYICLCVINIYFPLLNYKL